MIPLILPLIIEAYTFGRIGHAVRLLSIVKIFTLTPTLNFYELGICFLLDLIEYLFFTLLRGSRFRKCLGNKGGSFFCCVIRCSSSRYPREEPKTSEKVVCFCVLLRFTISKLLEQPEDSPT